MQPVQFQCGHCGKLMAVGSAHLGQQVRCPHCQQVVVAPPAESAAPPPALTETVLHTPAVGDGEDIFAPPEASEDLFDRPETPRIEMPPDPLAPTLPSDNVMRPPESATTLAPTLPWVPPESAPPGNSDGTSILPPSNEASWMSGTATEKMAPPPADVPPSPPRESPAAPIARVPRHTEAKTPWFLLLVFSPLLLYAIVITIFSVFLYRHEQELERRLRNPFEIMPDEGDKSGVQKAKQAIRWKYDPKLPTLPLPDSLCTTLAKHEPLRIGDLQIIPDRVERKRMKVVVASFDPEPCQGDSLVLYLRMKNLSSAYAFAPLDNYFDRRWQGGARPPFTLLEVGDKYRFHGGPADWYPRGDPTHRREWVEGRKDQPDVLQTGEQKELFVCTDGNDAKAVAVLFGQGMQPPYHGSFLWRVRVRRGLVRLKDKDYSATAVIGVRFSDEDIDKAPREVQ